MYRTCENILTCFSLCSGQSPRANRLNLEERTSLHLPSPPPRHASTAHNEEGEGGAPELASSNQKTALEQNGDVKIRNNESSGFDSSVNGSVSFGDKVGRCTMYVALSALWFLTETDSGQINNPIGKGMSRGTEWCKFQLRSTFQ